MNQKTRIRICIVVIIIGLMGFSDWSFAEEAGSEVKFLGYSLEFILSALSRIWVFFAKIAGIFLTNKWVYGEVLGWDVLLRKFRNIVKNFANFGLGLYFMYIVFKGLINQVKGEDATKNLKDTILRLLIAGIGIQSSRFLTATVIDVSSITLAAAGSFPSQILSESQYTEDSLKKALKDSLGTGGKNISLFPKDAKESSMLKTSVFELETSKLEGTGSDMEKLIDAVMPNQNNVSGPLYFIGFSFLKTNVITSLNTSSEATIKSVILNMLIQSGTTIVFSIEMLMLCIIALMRIVYLWMFIVLSPIVVLLKCLEKMGDKDLLNTNVVKSLGKQISLKTFLVNTFKPTFIVLGMGIAVIFVSLMQGVITESAGKSIDIGGTEISSRKEPSSNTNMEPGDRRYTSSIDSNLLKFVAVNMGKTLLELILSIIVVIMVYFIVRQAMSLGGGDDFISKRISGISKSFESLVMETPIVPIQGHDAKGLPKKSSISIKGITDLPETFINRNITQKITEYSAKQENEVMKMFGINDNNSLTAVQENDIKNIMKDNSWRGMQKLDKVKKYIGTIQTSEGRGMRLNPQTASNEGLWIKEFTNWLNNTELGDIPSSSTMWKDMITEWKNLPVKDLKTLFKNQKYAKAYAKQFGYDGSNPTAIMELDISKKQ